MPVKKKPGNPDQGPAVMAIKGHSSTAKKGQLIVTPFVSLLDYWIFSLDRRTFNLRPSMWIIRDG